MVGHRAAAALLALAASASHGNNCDSIRAGIEAKIRASGTKSFTLSVLPAETRSAGRVVGSCALGSKKIVYVQDGAASAAPARPAAKQERMLTECKDGSVTVGGDCKK